MKASAKRKAPRRPARGLAQGAASARPNLARQKARPISIFDRFLRNLPLAENEIQRIFNWTAVITFALILFFVARYFGAGDVIHRHYAQQAANAGFVLKRIEPIGIERADELKIYDLILAQKDRAMPLVDIEKIRADLMQYGWVKDVRVSRQLPDTLVVEIIERKPAAIWDDNGNQNLIDEQGIVLENVPVGSVPGLMVIRGERANERTAALAELLEEAPSLKPQIVAASWVGNRRWDLTFKSGETVALPEGEIAAAKALVNFARMEGVSRILGQDIIHFDLRDPDQAYLRRKPKSKPAVPSDSSRPRSDNDRGSGDDTGSGNETETGGTGAA